MNTQEQTRAVDKANNASAASYPDPRLMADFQAQHFPRVNGEEPPPPGAFEQNERIKTDFATIYYNLNRAHARMAALRGQPERIERRQGEKALLNEIERLLIARDQLEDLYAPLGVIAEPIARGGFTKDLFISFGNVDAAGRMRSEAYTLTACVPIPWPEGINFDDLPIMIEGPGIYPPELGGRAD